MSLRGRVVEGLHSAYGLANRLGVFDNAVLGDLFSAVAIYLDKPFVVGDTIKVADFSGVVEQINRKAEFTPRNVQTVEDRIKQVFGVKVRMENKDDALRAGMSADIFFPNVK